MSIITVIFLLASLLAVAHGDKQWTKNTNFENKDNWRRGEIPCKTDRIMFPKKSPVISVMKSLYVTDAYLPVDGELVLNDGVSLFAVPPEQMHIGTCHGKDTKYIRSKPLSWFDPANWCSMTQGGKCIQTRVHASMVPSQFDKVTFPNPKDSYFVDVDYDDSITVQGLNYRHQWQTTHGFRTYVNTVEGRKQFVNSLASTHLVPTITMTKKGCTDKSGCVPNTLNKRLFDKICSKVKCPKDECKRPIKITGSCCDWCGSQVLVSIGDGFSFYSLESQIRSTLSGSDGVQTDVLKIAPKTVQVALTDKEGGKLASKSVVDVAKMIKSKKENLGIISFSVKSSSGAMTSYNFGKGEKNVPVILGILFGFLFLVVIIVIAYDVHRRVRNGQLTLPQIQNVFVRTSPSNLRLSWSKWRTPSETDTHGPVNMEMRTTMSSFDNPVYRPGDINITPMDDLYDEPMSSIIEGSITNPVYQPATPPAKAEASAPPAEPGSIIIKRKEKIEIINKSYQADDDNTTSDA